MLSLAAVWLTTARISWCWPIGLASVLVSGLVFYRARLLSDTLLQLIFAVMQVYGWWQWRRAPQVDQHPAVRPMRRWEAWVPLAMGAAGTFVLGGITSALGAALPWIDAALTALSLVAQFWMARLIRASWLLWIAVDIAYVWLYWKRDLPPYSALSAIYIVLAIEGWRRWNPAAAAAPAP